MLEATSSALSAVQQPIHQRLLEVEDVLRSMVPAGFGAVDEVNDYIFSTSGKLFRPTLLLLAHEVSGGGDARAVRLAAIVELLHVATLVHDDAVDHSVRRRGMPTVNARWSHQVAVIVGDYLYSRAVIEITELGNLDMIRILAGTANRMTVGEMRQLVSHDALDFSRRDYFLLCECKTASLLSSACELGAMAGAATYREALASFGFQLGMTFQITDDLLDYTARAEVTGKPAAQDLREHKVTLPLIAALPEMDREQRGAVEALFADPEPPDDLVETVVRAVDEAGGVAAARQEAQQFASRAREALRGVPDGPALEALQAAVEYVVDRER